MLRLNLLFTIFVCSSSLSYALPNDFSYSAHAEGSYNYLLRSNQFTSTVHDRLFDLQQNGFTLQQTALNLAITPAHGFGAVGGVLVGRDAYSISPYGWKPYFGSQTLGMVITKAYLQYASNQWTVIGGLYDAEFGLESYNSTLNTNFSRSLLNDFAEPGFMVGLRGFYTLNSQYKFLLGINSGWTTIRLATHYPSLEYGLTYTWSPQVTVIFEGLSGQQRLVNFTSSGPVSRFDMLELMATYQATPALAWKASYDYGIQRKALIPFTIGQAVWQGISAYSDYQWNERWLTSVRGEVYSDGDGVTTGVRQTLEEITLTLSYQPTKNLLFRAETRHDFSNVSSFKNASGVGVSNNQQSYALSGIYMISS